MEGNLPDSHEIPPQWKYLPSLALPDGAHNYTKGTIFRLFKCDNPINFIYLLICYWEQMASYVSVCICVIILPCH